MQTAFANQFLAKNPLLARKPAAQIIANSIPGLLPVLEREQMVAQNPMKFVGDMGTRVMGGDPNASVLDMVDPGRTVRPVNPSIGRTAEQAITIPLDDTFSNANEGVSKQKPKLVDPRTVLNDPRQLSSYGKSVAPEEKSNAGYAALGQGIQALAASLFGGDEQMAAPSKPFQPVNPTFRPMPELGPDEFQKRLFRRKGGPVKPGQRYIVGEDGPEEIVVDQPGRVIANKDLDPAVLQQIAEQQGGGQQPVIPINPANFVRQDDPVQPTGPVPVDPRTVLNDPRQLSSYGEGFEDIGGGTEQTQAPMPVNPAGFVRPEDPAPLTAQDDAITPPRPVKPMTERERIQKRIEDRTNRDYSGKRDAEHPYREKGRGWKGTFKAAGMGFLQAFAQTDPRMRLSDRLLQAAGGGIAGGIGGTVDPNLANKQWNKQKLAELYGQHAQASKMEDEQIGRDQKLQQIEASDARIKQGDIRLKQAGTRLAEGEYDRGFRRAMQKLKLGYKKGAKPDLDAELARYGVDINQWDNNTKTFWQGQNLMTFDEDGEAVPVANAKGEVVTDITRQPVEVEFEGEKYTVTQTEAFRGKTAAAGKNTTFANADINDENTRVQQLGTAKAELSGVATEISGLKASTSGLTNQLSGLNPATVFGDAEKAARIQSQIQQNESKLIGLQGKQVELNGKIKTLSQEQQKRQSVSVPKISASVNENEFTERLKANKIPASEWPRLISQAKRDGVIK